MTPVYYTLHGVDIVNGVPTYTVLAAGGPPTVNTWTTIATVPAGHAWLISHLMVENGGGGAGGVSIAGTTSPGPYGAIVPLGGILSLDADGWTIYDGHGVRL